MRRASDLLRYNSQLRQGGGVPLKMGQRFWVVRPGLTASLQWGNSHHSWTWALVLLLVLGFTIGVFVHKMVPASNEPTSVASSMVESATDPDRSAVPESWVSVGNGWYVSISEGSSLEEWISQNCDAVSGSFYSHSVCRE